MNEHTHCWHWWGRQVPSLDEPSYRVCCECQEADKWVPPGRWETVLPGSVIVLGERVFQADHAAVRIQ